MEDGSEAVTSGNFIPIETDRCGRIPETELGVILPRPPVLTGELEGSVFDLIRALKNGDDSIGFVDRKEELVVTQRAFANC